MVGLPPDASALAMALGAGVLASTIGLLFVGLIGLSGVWLHDVTPAYWIWQKLTFVLGGLILPMEIYPPWLQRIAECTPFHAMLYSVGRWMLDFDAVTAARSSALQLGWIVLLLGVCAWASARAMHRIERRGE